MLEPRFFDLLRDKLSAVIAASPAKDIEKNALALLQSALAKLDFVSREEFDVQRDLLTNARARIEALEAQLGRSSRCPPPSTPGAPVDQEARAPSGAAP
jgi:BMFP domain-containing protein YqiC